MVDPVAELAFRCPAAAGGDGIDHVLSARGEIDHMELPQSGDDNPFVRFRRLLLPYRIGRSQGMDDDAWLSLVGALDEALIGVDGKGFRMTPFLRQPLLGLGVWAKDETGNVAGSHKGRHLMGVMLYLLMLEHIEAPAAQGIRERRLAISSCGNAALAAAVVARAADWPLDVYIPENPSEPVVQRLEELGAVLHRCARPEGQRGDPCVAAFRDAVEAGSLPFSVQGSENGLVVDGAKTIIWEMAPALERGRTQLDAIFIQVGGGTLASACIQALEDAVRCGAMDQLPIIHTVQTEGTHPLQRAHARLVHRLRTPLPDAVALANGIADAAKSRADFMWPWETPVQSLAHGILDDETYDWLAVVEGMLKTGGQPIVVGERRLEEATTAARYRAGIPVSPTGAAGLAGLMEFADVAGGRIGQAAVLLTGVAR